MITFKLFSLRNIYIKYNTLSLNIFVYKKKNIFELLFLLLLLLLYFQMIHIESNAGFSSLKKYILLNLNYIQHSEFIIIIIFKFYI